MTSSDWAALGTALTAALHPTAPPIAITFGATRAAGVPAHGGPMPAPLPDGRTSSVPAGCVFWVHATDRTFTTTKVDHGNCSVGSLTETTCAIPAARLAEVVAAVEATAAVDAQVAAYAATDSQRVEAVAGS